MGVCDNITKGRGVGGGAEDGESADSVEFVVLLRGYMEEERGQ